MTLDLPELSFFICKTDPGHISADPGAKLCLMEPEAQDCSLLGTWGGPGMAVHLRGLGVCSGARLWSRSAAASQVVTPGTKGGQ